MIRAASVHAAKAIVLVSNMHAREVTSVRFHVLGSQSFEVEECCRFQSTEEDDDDGPDGDVGAMLVLFMMI